mmetsp:Transcript_10130/g.29119  ORF Transcript_10130/g.29119 Transcript_10130/m.29119 type:complete len:219 (-) Transcript_10130:349-1005(-)
MRDPSHAAQAKCRLQSQAMLRCLVWYQMSTPRSLSSWQHLSTFARSNATISSSSRGPPAAASAWSVSSSDLSSGLNSGRAAPHPLLPSLQAPLIPLPSRGGADPCSKGPSPLPGPLRLPKGPSRVSRPGGRLERSAPPNWVLLLPSNGSPTARLLELAHGTAELCVEAAALSPFPSSSSDTAAGFCSRPWPSQQPEAEAGPGWLLLSVRRLSGCCPVA